MKTKTYLPIFPGFYGTIFEADETPEIEYLSEQEGRELKWDDIEWDYSQYNNQVAKCCCNYIERELSEWVSNIRFENIESPKYYNFSNDSINCEITFNAHKVIKYLKTHREEFTIYLTKYKSCSGFNSFYSYSPDEWINYESLKHQHKAGSILEFIAENEGITQDDLYYSLQDCYIQGTVKELQD